MYVQTPRQHKNKARFEHISENHQGNFQLNQNEAKERKCEKKKSVFFRT